MLDAKKIIEMFDLKPLPQEGGYYKESYRSDEVITADALPTRYAENKPLGSAIYYLLTPDTKSLMHKIKSDETFHFYLGDPVEMLQLFADSTGKIVTLGSDVVTEQQVQLTVPRQTWQGSSLKKGGKFALMGTTIAPGFDFDDFILGKREVLIKQYPDFKNQIINLTR
ncbi:MAG: cupin domain-containing protein [Candidatus Dadabacteria bacterium]|nr:cupin domain-containing protein [Candidatus Dadabacteria bacterium]NIS09546.1 cupin domain-containing protein [Candidatus Dadabacteria bacterium]NIV43038.1 cupin domain-containing protein [Candidatus Dadabacteria bacterium]NIY22723.1 cupin domain-containing protein [Candidatus Dadabacteria bacterium]